MKVFKVSPRLEFSDEAISFIYTIHTLCDSQYNRITSVTIDFRCQFTIATLDQADTLILNHLSTLSYYNMHSEKVIIEISGGGDGASFSNLSESLVFVLIYIIIFDKTCFLHVHDSSQPISPASATDITLQNLVVGMNGKEGPMSSLLLNEGRESGVSPLAVDFADSLSHRIAQRFQIQAFISGQLTCVKEVEQLVKLEREIVALLRKHFIPS